MCVAARGSAGAAPREHTRSRGDARIVLLQVADDDAFEKLLVEEHLHLRQRGEGARNALDSALRHVD
jgi:hypothetical protein